MKPTCDRKEICKIISEMLDNPDEHGIYNTTRAYDKLEEYVYEQRWLAIGYTHAYCCRQAELGIDPRKMLIPELVESAKSDLELNENSNNIDFEEVLK